MIRLIIYITGCVVLLMNISCSPEANEYFKPSDLIEYVRMLKPGIKSDQVKSLFPSGFSLIEKTTNYNTAFMRCKYSHNSVYKVLDYWDSKHKGAAGVFIYFDNNDILIGFDFSASSGQQFTKEDCVKMQCKECKEWGNEWGKE